MQNKCCIICKKKFSPTGRNAKYCGKKCVEIVKREKYKIWWKSNPRYKGCGSGGNQGIGESHHSYKNGIGIFHRHRKAFCERCGSDRFLCVHHKDENRTNNLIDNLETLCKSCHQRHHECAKNFPYPPTKKMRLSSSRRAKWLHKNHIRDKQGRLTKQRKQS